MTGLELAQVVVSTVATVCMVGLGFLYRPSRASAIWSVTFVVVMCACYAAMVANAAGLPPLQRGATGVLLAAPALVWSGLRALRGARPHEWIAGAVAVAAASVLIGLDGTDLYAWAFRLAYVCTAVFAALAVVELLRRPERVTGMAAPLAAFSLIVVGAAAVNLIGGFVGTADPGDALAFLRMVNSLGLLAYIVCGLVTLLFFARGGGAPPTGSLFHTVAAERLGRAQRAGERSWALVWVQLDDAADVRTVSADAGFAAILARVRGDIEELFPTEADIGRRGPASYAVLVALPASVLRERVRALLRAVAAPLDAAPLDAVPMDAVHVGTSASIGWAGVAEFGYDIDVLLEAARQAAERAAAAGGDRWERATG